VANSYSLQLHLKKISK